MLKIGQHKSQLPASITAGSPFAWRSVRQSHGITESDLEQKQQANEMN